VIGDPALRSAEGVALLSQQTTREAHILASTISFWWSACWPWRRRCGGGDPPRAILRRHEISPVILLQQKMAEQAAAMAVPPRGETGESA
jgi:hypothetical protein